jgi:uncharacterized protein
MNDATQAREPLAPQPATAIASHRVHPDKAAQYVEAQTAITNAARRFPGFVGTEILKPVSGLQEEWIAIFRLESNQAMKRWLGSAERQQLASRIEELLVEPSHLLVLASDDRAEPPVAMVFTHRVAPQKVPAYLEWRRKTIAAQARRRGYLASEFFEPREKSDEWVDIVRYDSAAALDDWIDSRERRDLLKELDSIVESVQMHRITGLEGWFAVSRGADEGAAPPPSWKQALAVLFALYPTVMLLTFLNPLMGGLSLAVQMLIGNIISVALLTWLVMPWVSQLFGFWLGPTRRDWKGEALGLCMMAAGIAAFVLIFRVV